MPPAIGLAMIVCLLIATAAGQLARHVSTAGGLADHAAAGLGPRAGDFLSWLYPCWTRNLTMELRARVEALRFLVRDRDTKFIAAFDEVFGADGVSIIKTPPQAPRANAICERLVGTLRREVLDRMLIFNGRHLFKILTEYAQHYNDYRPHQSHSQ
jgi:transposase InsO family protein